MGRLARMTNSQQLVGNRAFTQLSLTSEYVCTTFTTRRERGDDQEGRKQENDDDDVWTARRVCMCVCVTLPRS